MQEAIGLRGKKLWSHMLDANHVFHQMLLESVMKEKLCFLTRLFRRSIEGVGQESRGWGTEEWMLTLTLPPRHLPFLKVAKKVIFQKEYKCANIFKRLEVNFSFCRNQENRGVEVNLGFASASVPRKKSPAASFVSQKFQHSMLQNSSLPLSCP